MFQEADADLYLPSSHNSLNNPILSVAVVTAALIPICFQHLQFGTRKICVCATPNRRVFILGLVKIHQSVQIVIGGGAKAAN